MNKRSFLDEFVHQKGRRFYANLLPEDIQRGEVGDCFDHCLLQAVYSKGKYFYCEGVAYINGAWRHHAWLTNKEALVAFDPTWNAIDQEGRERPLDMVFYLGAVLNLDLVIKFVVKTEYKSPLANHEKNPEIADEIFKTAV